MDFFQHQDDARRRTVWLVALFVLAVLVIIVMVYAAVATFVWFLQAQEQAVQGQVMSPWQPTMLAAVAVGVIVIVGGGSMYKIAQLAGGGQVVASSLGGRPLSGDTRDPDERKLLNVVEEMAIASGTPVPPVYLLEREGGINAFAAGYSPANAVIGVTRGAIEQLDRDELQGVVAHEFSHILSGDMRLNIRLIGVIHGILVIGLIGYGLLRAAGYGAATSRRSSRDNALPALALGLALLVIGYAGTFFGRLIKAAVSRQREFLADAAAVQFTRQPDGLAGALKKIGGYSFGSRLVSPKAEQASHMLFGQGLRLSSLFATHPPLPVRIRRIQPSWDGEFPPVEPSSRLTAKAQRKRASLRGEAIAAAAGPTSSFAQRIAQARAAGAGAGASAVERIGDPAPRHLAYAAALIDAIPQPLREAAREPFSSRAVVFLLLLDRDAAVRREQLRRLASDADRPVYETVERLSEMASHLPAQARLPLLDMALPALQRLSPAQHQRLKRNIDSLIRADDRIDLFEWTLRRIVLHHLDAAAGRARPPRIRHRRLGPLGDELAAVLSALAWAGHDDPAAAERAFTAGLRRTGMVDLPMRRRDQWSAGSLDAALDAFAAASPGVKRTLLRACATCIEADGAAQVREGELLRAIADSLDCPMPPILPGQSLA